MVFSKRLFSILVLFLSFGVYADEAEYPSSEVLQIAQDAVLLQRALNQAFSNPSLIRHGCFYLGQANTRQQNLLKSASRISTLLQGLVMTGKKLPQWLIDLEKVTENAIPYSAQLSKLAEPCTSEDESDLQLDRQGIKALEKSVIDFTDSLKPYVSRAIDEIPLP